MGEMRCQQGTIRLIDPLDQPMKHPWGIPQAMDKHKGPRHGAPWRARSTATTPSNPGTGAAHLLRVNRIGTAP